MERAAGLIKSKKLSREILSDEELARAIWPAAVGKAITAHTGRLKLVRTTLVVEVEDAIWQKQLHTLSAQILQRLRALSKSDFIADLEFRIGIPRKQTERATLRAAQDEAEQIQDPVMKKLYRMSRNKAAG